MLKEIDLKIVFDILKSISIIIASTIAIYGINSWRRETKWKRKYELAEEVLSLFYEIQNVISIIRSPMSHGNEGKTRKKKDNEDPEDSEILDRAYVAIERLEKHIEPFNKLRTLKFRFITVFGKDSEKSFNDITKLTNRIIIASNRLGSRYWKDQGRKKFINDTEFDRHLNKMHELENIIWDDSTIDEKDNVTRELERTIEEIEKICKPVIRKN